MTYEHHDFAVVVSWKAPSGLRLRQIIPVVGNSYVRDKPTSQADIIATLRPGTRIQVVGRSGDISDPFAEYRVHQRLRA